MSASGSARPSRKGPRAPDRAADVRTERHGDPASPARADRTGAGRALMAVPGGETPQGTRAAGSVPAETRAGDLADRIAQVVRACPGVVDMAAGTVATHLARRTVRGVAVRDQGVRIAVVAEYGRPLAGVAARVRAAVQPLVPGEPVDVHVEDVRPPGPAKDRR
ncbi:hypothetical protein [Sphaerisporangium aureirubrum]|uniref:Asp23/Gls24 family envelope stress response protein n=1 Tax=Sphaerisporangium aureirubrum TaxID=1544736 RepID=A0ABW1NER3_9ACTN